MRFAIRVKPGARADAVGGAWDGPNGPALVVAVTARAVEGKANEAVRRVLATALGVRGTDIAIVAGERGRDKIVSVDPAPTGLAETLTLLRSASKPGHNGRGGG